MEKEKRVERKLNIFIFANCITQSLTMSSFTNGTSQPEPRNVSLEQGFKTYVEQGHNSVVCNRSAETNRKLESDVPTEVSKNTVSRLIPMMVEEEDVEEEEEEESFMRITSKEETRGKFSTTSTVYAEHTIINPDYDQVLFW